jgi:CheY-like chemotaxis protein
MDSPLSLRVLLADDNPDTLLTLSVWLKQDGHIVRTVHDGRHVMSAVREFQPNVCILDIQMPGASGFAIADQMREMYGSLRPFMIAISGRYYEARDRLSAMGVGFDHFLEKPADPRELSYLLGGVSQRLAA